MFGIMTKERKPKPIKIELPKMPPKEFEKLYSSINYKVPGLTNSSRLRNFLIEQQIPIYNEKEVHDYMAKLARKKRKIYVWKPLRDIDKENRFQWGEVFEHGQYKWFDDKQYGVYPHPVPIHILNDVKIIHDKFGNEAKFFVTDYAVKMPDPFILVTLDGIDRIIFGAWDEPGFGVV